MLTNLKSATVWFCFVAAAAGFIAQQPISAQEPEGARKITKKVAPAYPPLALQAHLTGMVRLIAVVTPEGAVKSVRTVGGNAVLAGAAEEAVKKWKFETSKKESIEPVALKFGNP